MKSQSCGYAVRSLDVAMVFKRQPIIDLNQLRAVAMADQKLVSIFIILVMHLLLLPHHAFAQQNQLTQIMYQVCGNTTFSFNSAFSTNRNNVFAILTQHISSSLYYYASSNTSSSSDHAYAVYQCRADISSSDCYSCVYSWLLSLPCGSVTSARTQCLGCFLRYENYDFGSSANNTFVYRNCSSSTNANSSFQTNLASVLNTAATVAATHGGFNASSIVSNRQDSVYALAQCLGYLSQTQCATCLAQDSSYKTICQNSVAGQVYYTDCYYLFSNTPVLISSTGSANAPTSSPTNPAISSPTSPARISGAGGTKGGSKTTVVIATIVGVILLGAVGVLFLLRRRKQATNKSSWTGSTDDLYSLEQEFQVVATRYSLDELRQATGNFHLKNKLGEGGFGPVYKGRLRNNKKVAIKMLSSKSHQGKQEFLNEVNLITNVQHRNLIELLGCCVEDSNRLLVYEYLPKRSLDLHLFDNVARRAVLGWRTRIEIIIGIAKGLEYLHEDSHVKVVHRDIKASNILLDNNFNPKIADFGLARLFADRVTHMTTRVAGTLGYLSPEYAINGQLTEKADVYSFGLVTLEIVSGRRIIDKRLPQEEEHLLAWTWALYQKHQQLQIVDPKVGNAQVNAEEVIRVVHVALLCTQTWPGSRPAMSQLVAMLCGQSAILPIPNKPTIISKDPNQRPVQLVAPISSASSLEESRLQEAAASLQDVSISQLEGR